MNIARGKTSRKAAVMLGLCLFFISAVARVGWIEMS